MIEVVEETASTNADLVRRLGAGESIGEGFWLRAERQSAGRGRRDRVWSSPAGNLYASTVVALRPGDPPAHSLAFVAALAVRDLIVLLHPPGTIVQLKWPNDVLVEGAKISGILLERRGDDVIVGVGVNVVSAPELVDRATTFMRALAKRDIDAAEVLETLVPALAERLVQWRREGLPAILSAWQQGAYPHGTALKVMLDGEGEITGTFAGLGQDGALCLRLADSSLRVIHAGDVSLV